MKNREITIQCIVSIAVMITFLLASFSNTGHCNNDPQVLSWKAVKLYQSGKYREAIPLAEQSLAIYENTVGPHHQLTAITLDLLARLYLSIGDNVKAEQACRRALAIQEQITDSQDPSTVLSLELLSEVYIANWELTKAEQLLERALAINERSFGPQDPNVARILNDLGVVYSSAGNYNKAESVLQRSLSINEKSQEPEHLLEVATNLQNLSGLYCEIGAFTKAEPLIQRAISIREKKLGSDHPDLAICLVHLAGVYSYIGAYAKIQPLLQRAVAITEKLEPWHPDLANSLHNLGRFYCDAGDYSKAESCYLRALKIREKISGTNHPDFTMTQNNLALCYKYMGDPSKAEPLFRRALASNENTLGPEHPDVALILHNLAATLASQKKLDQALPLMLREQTIENGLMDQVMGFTSEAQKMEYLAKLRYDLDCYLTIVLTLSHTDKKVRDDAFTVWLKRKGAALEAQRQFQQAVILSGNQKSKAVFERLTQLCTEITKLTFSGPGQSSAQTYQALLGKLKIEQADLEAELARLCHNYARSHNRPKVDVKTVAAALPPGSALVDFAKINIFDFEVQGLEKPWLPPHYIAFVLPAGAPDRLALFDLGAAPLVEQAVSSLKHALQNSQDAEAIDQSARTLCKLIFSPLAAELGDAKYIFISPDGDLNLVPFEILQDTQNHPLIETYTFNYLCSGRDLIGMDETSAATGPALVLGDPDFNLQPQETKTGSKVDQSMQPFQRSADLRTLTLTPLPATRAEAKAVAEKLGGNVRLRLGSYALEDELHKGPAPRYLHLATHGFFLSDQEMLDVVDYRNLDSRGAGYPPPRAASTSTQKYENPLLRSAVALAGANVALKGRGVDGVVTAEKFLSMPISGTELVVLSACQTGLGDVKTGEGVFGLRRAVTHAGAKGMVMSMWSVPDQETQELMETFYDNLAKNLPKAQALRQAALKERDVVIKRFGTDNPFYWGAFIYIGDK